MAKFSKKGWSSDFREENFTSDQLERYVDGLRDDLAGRGRDSAATLRRFHGMSSYIKGFGDSGLIKTDFNTDYQRAQANDPEACFKVGYAFLYGDEANHVQQNYARAISYLETAVAGGFSKASTLLCEAKVSMEKARADEEDKNSLYRKGLAAEARDDWETAHRFFKAAAKRGMMQAVAEIEKRAQYIKAIRRQSDIEIAQERLRKEHRHELTKINAEIFERTKDARRRFAGGDGRAAIEIASLYLDNVNFTGMFEKAVNWSRFAYDKGVVDTALLIRMAHICDSADYPFLYSIKRARNFYRLAAKYGGEVERRALDMFNRTHKLIRKSRRRGKFR